MNAVTTFGGIAAKLRDRKKDEVTIPCNHRPTIADTKTSMAMLLAYQPGDRCIRCRNGAFYIGRVTATCSNPNCEMPVPLALA